MATNNASASKFDWGLQIFAAVLLFGILYSPLLYNYAWWLPTEEKRFVALKEAAHRAEMVSVYFGFGLTVFAYILNMMGVTGKASATLRHYWETFILAWAAAAFSCFVINRFILE